MNKQKITNKETESYFGIAIILLIGLVVLLYPHASNLWNEYQNNKIAETYMENIEGLSETEQQGMYQEAIKYNEQHQQNNIIYDIGDNPKPHQQYQQLLNIEQGSMGTLIIPKIKQKLVIYHGLADDILEKGCGHIEGTSLPVGGESTHGVYAAHRGIPKAKLFTDLDQLEKGDVFYFHILGEYLAYEVDQIKVVLPKEVNDIQIEEGKDLVTLITCTPYAVNSHRLLVRGHRIPYEHQQMNEDSKQVERNLKFKIILAIAILIGIIILFILLFCPNNSKSI